jgi:hypothetical protein
LKPTVTSALPAVKDVIVGFPGTAQVVILLEAFDVVDPAALVAVTVNVYVVPLASPFTV